MSEEKKNTKPFKFKTIKDLEKGIEAYFERCNEEGEPLTVTGLALALDTSRQTLMEYQVRDGYGDIVRRAKLRIEHACELRLIARGNGGDIFAMKNFGWSDKQEIEHSGDSLLKVELTGEIETWGR